MSETPGSEGDETGWETASSNPTPTTKQFPPAQLPGPEEKAEKNKDRRKVSDDPIEQYWRHRGRLVKHLEKRFEQFQKRSREDYDRARNPYPPKAKKPAVQQPAPVPAPVPGPVPAQITPPRQAGKKAAAQSAVRKTEVEGKTGMSLRAVSAVGNGAKARVAAVRNSTLPKQPIASTSRTIATTPSTSAAVKDNRKKPVKSEYTMDLPEAARVLRAFEIASPQSTYTLMIRIREKNKTKPKHAAPLRGRITLPMDPRRSSDTVLVFAEPNSASRRLVEEVGVTYLGGDELFEPLLSGEITPTKVLSTPGMLPSVTQALARFLGPKGLMPTTRRGGVGEGEELVARIKEAKGSLDWKADERGWVMAVIGRMHFPLSSIEANVRAFVSSVKQGSASANPSPVDDALASRKATKRTPGLVSVKLETTNCHSIELKDVV